MKLSIIVPVYNMVADNKLSFCMDSLVNQTIDDYEIIAVDDHSPDDSVKLLRQYEEKYPGKVKVIESEENGRQGTAKNKGIKYSILPFPDGTIRDIHDNPDGIVLDPDALVSMNLWGFAPDFFEAGMAYLDAFLKDPSGDPLKKECLLPALVDTLMHTSGLQVEVLSTRAVWFGVTYKEDKDYVAAELRKLHDDGTYPAVL